MYTQPKTICVGFRRLRQITQPRVVSTKEGEELGGEQVVVQSRAGEFPTLESGSNET